jgi:hypothetical protein
MTFQIQYSGDVINRDPEDYPYMLQLLGAEFLRLLNKAAPTTLQALERIAALAGEPEPVLQEALASALALNQLGIGSTPHTSDYSLVCALAEALRPECPGFAFMLKVKGFYRSLVDTNREGLMNLANEYKTITVPDPEVVESMLKLLQGEGQFLQLLSHGWGVLVHSQNVIDRAVQRGDASYECFQAELDTLAVNAIDNDSNGKCLFKHQNLVNVFLARIHLEVNEDGYEQERDDVYNTTFRLLARQAKQRNLFAQSLKETLSLMCTSVYKAMKLSTDGIATLGFQACDPKELVALVLDTFQMDTEQLVLSFKLAEPGQNQAFRGASSPLAETVNMDELNRLLDSIEHDPVALQAGYTNLMVALLTVRVMYPDILKADPERLDDLLDQLLPHADIPTAMERLPEAAKPEMEDFIMRRHQEFRRLVSLQGMGRVFSADLGI